MYSLFFNEMLKPSVHLNIFEVRVLYVCCCFFLFLAAFLLNDAAEVHEDILSLVSVGHYF